MEPQDHIIDPSCPAYFVRPCPSEWYFGARFQERNGEGSCMQEMRQVALKECPWMPNTCRLGMFPDEVAAHLKGQYVLLNQGGGLTLSRW